MDSTPRTLAASQAAAPSPLPPPVQNPEAPEQQLTWALALFQAEVMAIASPDLGTVAAAAKPALRQGIGWSARLGDQYGRTKLQVTLRHVAGAELSSETWAPEPGDLAATAGLLLAMLLGIPVSSQAQAVKPSDTEITVPVSEPVDVQAPLAPPLQAAGPDPQDRPLGAEPDHASPNPDPAADPGLEPLSPDEIGDFHRRILALPQGARRELTNAFREHFSVPRNARSIGDRISQRQHGRFLEHFLAEAQEQVPAQEQVLDATPLPLVP